VKEEEEGEEEEEEEEEGGGGAMLYTLSARSLRISPLRQHETEAAALPIVRACAKRWGGRDFSTSVVVCGWVRIGT